jgi:hypothetical protein
MRPCIYFLVQNRRQIFLIYLKLLRFLLEILDSGVQVFHQHWFCHKVFHIKLFSDAVTTTVLLYIHNEERSPSFITESCCS